jgi:hypothetical protein
MIAGEKYYLTCVIITYLRVAPLYIRKNRTNTNLLYQKEEDYYEKVINYATGNHFLHGNSGKCSFYGSKYG